MSHLRQELRRLRCQYEMAAMPLIERMAQIEIERAPWPNVAVLSAEQADEAKKLFRIHAT